MSDPYAAFATNAKTKFSPFSIKLKNGATLTGIAYLPTTGTFSKASNKPLIIGIHGATTSAHSWDIHPDYTASTFCDLLGIPFVAFHRPNFLQSSGWIIDNAIDNPEAPKSRMKAPEGSQIFVEEGRWYH
ncbi:hypothetical protein HII31_02842 [Pseudocercospora fuligena]|uniref:Uncharacterized protein n=1 Tax=Pseudocercospora fuligena TaxID=685502 RepID=A0A8H6RPX2_9PEZI|nr:hypothetical protein HII31_02842 [Pseudocercospora fuligena]